MIINNSNAINHNESTLKSRSSNVTEKTTSENVINNSDTVALSKEALDIKRLEQQALNAPDVDTDRVTALQQAISDGNYEINADIVAGKMLDFDN